MKLKIIRYAAYSLEIILLLVLQGTPELIPEVFGGKPVLLVSFALGIAAVEEVVPSLAFAAVCGALADISAGGTIGFFAVSLTLLCYALCCLTRYYFSGGAAIAVVLCLAATVLILGARFLLFALPQGGAELFVSHYISRMIYTFAATVPLYFLNRFLSDALK